MTSPPPARCTPSRYIRSGSIRSLCVQSVTRRRGWRLSSGAAVFALTLLGLLVAPSHAADDKKNDREARRAELLQQRLEQERAAWQTERAELQKKVSDAEASTAQLKTQSDQITGALAKTSSDKAALQKTVAELNKQIGDLKSTAEKNDVTNKAELQRLMQAREQERVAQNSRFDRQASALSVCTDKNQRLVAIGHELLQRYRDKNVLQAMSQEEPFLGIKDVEIFNQVQDYRGKIDSEQLPPGNAAQ